MSNELSTSEMLGVVDDGAPSIADEYRTPEENAEALRKARKKQMQKLEHALRKVLGTAEGIRVLSFVINDLCGGLSRSAALPEFNQGERNIALALIELCARADAEKTVRIIAEHADGR